MATGNLTLDRSHLVAMLTSVNFYIEVPSFLYLQEAATAAKMAATQATGCHTCGDEWIHMRGVVDAFFLRIREMVAGRHPAIDDIKRYLSNSKGYTVTKCTLYYRRSRTQGKIEKFVF